jgi:aerobic-type carbon monoxide dehydrogenase small subunit (CoxS/CutS family)
MNTARISMTINGALIGPHEIPDVLSMIDYLHEYCGLTGTKFGCGIGACRACVIIQDNDDGTSRTVPACVVPAIDFNGKKVRTIEGHAVGERLTSIQEAFLQHFSFQCGYCTPGFVNEAQVLVETLAREPVPKAELEGRILATMDSHICRCTGYVRYYEAIRAAIRADPRLTR